MNWGTEYIGRALSVLLVLSICIGGVAAMSTPVQNLAQSCTFENTPCTVTKDSTTGACRSLEYSTRAGPVAIQVCDKGGAYELYRQTAPTSLSYKACVGGGCIGPFTTFVRFTSTSLPAGMNALPTTSETTEELQVVPTSDSTSAETMNVCTGPYLVSPTSQGFAGETRDANYERLINAWFKSGNVVQTVQCSEGTCLWVPWYKSSSSCGTSDLQSGSNCKLSHIDHQNNCLVTDEFSQVGMTLAMSDDQTHFDQWVNTVKELKSAKYGQLPVWKAARYATGINSELTTNQDDASDASARVIIALYVAGHNDRFGSAKRAEYRAFADALSADLAKYDFVKKCLPSNNGKQICNWLASGAATGTSGNLGSWDFSYGGYHGDVILAMLAAYKNTGNDLYRTIARDTAENYLLAANYDGGAFRVPPKAFRWDTSSQVPKAVCTNNCGSSAWDDSDAVRAVSVCKAIYYASLNNVVLSTDLNEYCQKWMTSGGVAQGAYSIQYKFDGAPLSNPQRGYYQNGLGAYLNFYQNQGDLRVKVDEALGHFDTGTQTFDKASCMGVYRSTFPIISLGSAIGRDTKAFGSGVAACTTISTPSSGTSAPTTEPAPTPDPNAYEPVAEPYVTPTATPDGTLSSPNEAVLGLQVRSHTYVGGPASTLVKDVTKGGCRTMVYTNAGTLSQVTICYKNPGFEMYLQTPSTNGKTITCHDTHCVGPANGFAKW